MKSAQHAGCRRRLTARLIHDVRWNQETREVSMRTRVGLWIDHRKAIVVAITETGEEIGLIISQVEKQLRRSGDSPLKGPYESEQVPADDSRQRTFTGHLNIYYDAVIACIRDSESILIFGPGEAKGELKERLEGSNLGGRVVGIETAGRMTDRQIAAKVRQHFPGERSTRESRRNPLTRSSSRRGKPRPSRAR
jgi:hypothetical protein